MIDPIDGTANFVSGIPCWTIVISLVANNNLIAGFIFDLIYEELYIATLGGGAFCNERAILFRNVRVLKRDRLQLGFQIEVSLVLLITWFTNWSKRVALVPSFNQSESIY